VVGVFNRNEGKMRNYVNGVECSNPVKAITGGSLTNGVSLRVGYANFSGYLDDVRIYNRALSEGEIQYLYIKTQARYK
jgi:hypothetical protein